MRRVERPSGIAVPVVSANLAAARSKMAWVARAVSGVFSEGFQTTELPHTKASAAFQLHTATGKLKAEMTPTTPSGCQVSIMRWFGAFRAYGETGELAREPGGEDADIDHLLNFAEAFGEEFAGLDGDDATERGQR